MTIRFKLYQIIASLTIAMVFSLIPVLAADHIVIPITSHVKPVTVNVTLYSGPVSVTGYAGKEVILDVQSGKEAAGGSNIVSGGSTNTKRISSPETGLVIHEENNVVQIGTGMERRLVQISLQVPLKTNLVVNTGGGGNIIVNKLEGDIRINNKAVRKTSQRVVGKNNRAAVPANDIEVHQASGEIEINNGRGSVLLDRISGSAVVYTYNGNLSASFIAVKAGKPMSFSSMNGTVDIWLPPSIKADVIAQSAGGVIHSNFDIKINNSSVGSKTGGKQKRYVGYNNMDRTIVGRINGGGPEIRFKTFKGNIYFRKFSAAPAKPQPTK